MDMRSLGESQLSVAPIGLGTWAMGATVETWGCVDDNESIAAIHQAVDRGINLIDTAPIYGLGHSETIVGRAIRHRRSDVLLATKCGLLFRDGDVQTPHRSLAPESILRECDDSLRRLKTDTIDLYQCHWPDPDTPIKDTMGALTSLLAQGKIRAIGVSNFSCEQIAAAREFGPIHAVQVAFSMLHRRAADDLIPFCREHNIAVLAYSPLAKGLLTGKFGPNDTFEDIRSRDPDFIGDRFQQNLRIVDALSAIAARYDKTAGQLALNWTITHPGVTAALAGAKRPSQVRENTGGTGWAISDEDRTAIEHILRDGPA